MVMRSLRSLPLSLSSLAPVLLFRRRLKTVADVLKGIRHVFMQTRWDALQVYWSAVCRHGPCGPICSLDFSGTGGFLQTCMASISGSLMPWCFFFEFSWQVVVGRKDVGLHKWANWLREDSGSRPFACVPLSCYQGPSDSDV